MNLSFLFILTVLTIVAEAERDKFKATIKKLKCSLDISHNCKTVILRSSVIKCNTKRTVRVANAVVKSAKGSSFTLSFVATKSKTSITKALVKCKVPIKTTPKPTTTPRPPTTPQPPTTPPPTTTMGPGRMKCRCMCKENFICDCDCPSKNSGSTDCPKGFKRVCPTLSDGTCGSREMMCDGGENLGNRDGSSSFVESILGKVIQEDRMDQMEAIDEEEHCTCIPDMVLHLIKPRANRTSTRLTEDSRRISGAIVIRNVLIQNPNVRCTFKLVCSGDAINTLTSKAKCTPSQKKPLNKKVKLTSAVGDTFLVAIIVRKTVTKITWGTCLPVSNPTTTTVPLSMSSSSTVETISTSGKTSSVEQGNGTTQVFGSGNGTTSESGSEIVTTTTSGSESESTSARRSTTSIESESGSTLESFIETGTPEEFFPEKRTTQEVVSQNELTDCVCIDVKSTETGSGSGSVNETESGCGSGSDGLSRQCQGNVTETADEVVTRVKGYIDAGTCGAVSCNGNTGTGATSYYNEFIYNGKRVIISSQVPDHDAEHDMLNPNPNTRCERWQYIELPIDPSKGSSFTETSLGTTGLAVTGGAFFNHLSNPQGDLAMPNEGTGLDSCFGHSAQQGAYHYHANINCTDAGSATGANDPDTCLLIGYMRDGVPVYGFCRDSSGMEMNSCYSLNSGVSTTSVTTAGGTYTMLGENESDYSYDSAAFSAGSCNLDEGSGAIHPTTGEYSYFMTTGYPWVPIAVYGDQGTATYCSAADGATNGGGNEGGNGPPGGGPPGGGPPGNGNGPPPPGK